VIIGKILENEIRVKFDEVIHCNNCGKQVPGGLQTGKSYYQTKPFEIELEKFKKSYLCGICRDKNRLESRELD
jgi:DNA-directed RNA polymerase subunit RPC12/RpoP